MVFKETKPNPNGAIGRMGRGGRKHPKKHKEDYAMNIMVRCVSGGEEGKWKQMEFHKVDLDNKQISSGYLPSIITRIGCGEMLMLKSNILLLGGEIGLPDDVDDDEDKSSIHIHEGSSRFSLSFNTWKPAELPLNRAISNPAVVSTRICCFGFPWLRPEISICSIWHKLGLPDHLQGRQVSLPVVPDHSKSRFIVHLPDQNQLYAFQPPTEYRQDGDWTLLSDTFSLWTSAVVVVVDGILLFHQWGFIKLLVAYDLTSNTWLDVDSDLSQVKIQVGIFQSMFTLPGKGLVCLVSRIFPFDKTSPSVHFLRLKVKRIGSSKVKLIALDYQSHHIPVSSDYCDFLMLY